MTKQQKLGDGSMDGETKPRASSRLLEAAKDAFDTWCEGYAGKTLRSMNRLRHVIQDELARGPSEVDELRKKLDEALARAEKAEASADAKLRKLRAWVEDDDGSGDGLVDRSNLVDEIDRLLANHTSEDRKVASVDRSWRHVLSGWLKRHASGSLSSISVLEDLVEILVRRELARSGK